MRMRNVREQDEAVEELVETNRYIDEPEEEVPELDPDPRDEDE